MTPVPQNPLPSREMTGKIASGPRIDPNHPQKTLFIKG
jgi:hypothetical protein